MRRTSRLGCTKGLPSGRALLLASAAAAVSLAFGPAAVRAQSAPNILYIVADDLGYSDLHAFGGEIRTPNLDQLVRSGRILTNYHVGSVCAITRSMMYTGVDHHLAGEGTMGAPNDERRGLPGYEGWLNSRVVTVAQLLQTAGYHTYMTGKWHLGNAVGTGIGNSPLGQTPDQWGWEQTYTLLGGATRDHFERVFTGTQNYTYNGTYVQPNTPGQPGGSPGWVYDGVPYPGYRYKGVNYGFYDADFYAWQLQRFIDHNISDGKPFLAWINFTTPHWPLQVPEPYLSEYKGLYNYGYLPIRAARIARQRQLGFYNRSFVVNPGRPETLTSSPATPNYGTPNAFYINAVNPDPVNGAGVDLGNPAAVDYEAGPIDPLWDSLTPAQVATQERYMEIYAGMVSALDHYVGDLVQHLKDLGVYQNTIIIFHSDNGAEGSPLSPAQEALNEQGYDTDSGNFASLGLSGSNVQYGLRWAEVSATPLFQAKAFEGEGGVSAPFVIHLPGQTTPLPKLTDFIHVRDITPTLLDFAGVAAPSTPAPPFQLASAQGSVEVPRVVAPDGRYVYAISGKSFKAELLGTSTGPLHAGDPQGDEAYGRAYVKDGNWKLLWTEPPFGPLDGHWQLFNITTDRGETNDISAANPTTVEALLQEWAAYMSGSGGVEPLQPNGPL